VIFDLDGTLYTVRLMRLRMTVALRSSLGLLRQLGPSRRALRGAELADGAAVRGALHAELARRAGTTAERAEAWYEGSFMPAFVELLRRHGRVRPGLVALLEGVRRRGVRTAVVSDYGRVSERLVALRIDPALFDDLVAAEDHGVLKPSGIPLTAVVRRWDLPPSDVIAVGDREDLDAASARAAGMEFLGAWDWKRASMAIEARTEFGVTT
jgi:FMN phosphatase YigB (HAD superfamily)